jgi:hypothetical protein
LLEVRDLGVVQRGKAGGDATAIDRLQGDQAERVADPALLGPE